MYGDRAWRGGNSTKVLYRVSANEEHRVGNGVPKWKAGDLLIVEEHTGDCFYDYRFVRYKNGALKCTRKTAGYALCFGVPIPERTYFQLMAGDEIPMLQGKFDRLMRKIDKMQKDIEDRVAKARAEDETEAEER